MPTGQSGRVFRYVGLEVGSGRAASRPEVGQTHPSHRCPVVPPHGRLISLIAPISILRGRPDLIESSLDVAHVESVYCRLMIGLTKDFNRDNSCSHCTS